jgi:hypothetical protein
MNLLGTLAKLKAIGVALAALFPSIIAAVDAAETAIGPGNGATKLQFVQDFLKAVYSGLQNAGVLWEDLLPTVNAAVSALVNAFNAIKAFGHAGQPAAPVVAAPVAAKT